MLCMALLCGCGKTAKETITNRKIPVEDVTEFYYTVENINYDAFYKRYHFYKDDGKYMFRHETRERPGRYGPATEEDITSSGTLELSDDEWKDFLTILKDGTVSALVWDGDSATEGAQYANLVIEASATADLSASTLVVDIAGDFTNSGSVTFGNAALTVSGNFTSSGSFTQTAGTLTLSGSGATQSLSVQSQTHKTDAAVFYNVVIASSARVETASSFTVSGNWTVESGALFSVLSSDEAESVITFTVLEAQGGCYRP